MSSVYSNGIHSHHTVSQYNRVSLGCGEMGFSHHVCVADNCAVLPFKYGPKSLRNVSQTLLYPCHEELRQFRKQKVQNGWNPFARFHKCNPLATNKAQNKKCPKEEQIKSPKWHWKQENNKEKKAGAKTDVLTKGKKIWPIMIEIQMRSKMQVKAVSTGENYQTGTKTQKAWVRQA